MPLKVDDLKTFEAYKKAMKADVTKIKPEGDTKFWFYRDVELPTASGRKQKLPLLITLVDNRAVLPALQGKKMACKGTVGLVEGKIAFQADQGNLPYKQLKTSVPLLLGKMLQIPPNVEIDEEDEEENEEKKAKAKKEEAPKAKTAPPKKPAQAAAKGPNRAQLIATWQKLSAAAKQYVAQYPAARGAVAASMAGISDMLKGGQLAEAFKRLTQLQNLLKAPPAAPSGGTAGAANSARLSAAWQQLSAAAKKHVAAYPARRGAVAASMNGIPEMIKGGQFPEVAKRLAQLQTLLKTPPVAAGPNYAQLRTVWVQLVQRLKQAVTANPSRAAELMKAAGPIPPLLKAGNAKEAQQHMAQLIRLLKVSPAAR